MLRYLFTLILLHSSILYAQEADTLTEPPEIQEPAEVVEEQEQQELQADVTIKRDKDKVIEEYRINGRLYMVRVIPSVGKPYFIKFPENGRAIRGELDDIQTPYWKLFEW